MDSYQSKHFRVRDCSNYNMDIEKFIKSLEEQFKIDFKTLPQWKELIQVMNIVQTEYKMKLQRAGNRKIHILQNIFIQNSRPTPFELTDKLARTSKLWQDIKLKVKKRRILNIKDEAFSPSCEDILINQEIVGEVSGNESNAHPNTEEIQSKDLFDVKLDTDQDFKSPSSPLLPVTICTNQHKIISPIGSNYTPLKNQEHELIEYDLKSDVIENDLLLTSSKLIKYHPNEIIITNSSSTKQSFKLFLTNCCNEYVHIRFKNVTDSYHFKNTKIRPSTPVKLYPGLTVVLNFIYTLQNNNEGNDISSLLCFRINRNVVFETTEEILCIPIISKFVKSGNISVSETVSIPPAYTWHVTSKCGYPKALVHIKNNDDVTYYLHVRKKIVDFSKEFSASIKSVEVISPDTDSLIQRIEDNEVEAQSKILSSPNAKHIMNPFLVKINDVDDTINTIDVIMLILNDIIDLALEPFVFKQTCLRILPQSKKLLLVYFTKVHHIGCHQNYYDLVFSNSETDDIVIAKTIKVFAEVLPHPIILQPKILDMTKSPVNLGYWEDNFTIINSHKIYPVTIKIKTTTKMKKIFKIIPMETIVLPKSTSNFKVQICLRNLKGPIVSDDLAYFTIKILIVGHKSVYRNIPPLFYEIIAPCVTEFKQVYGKKYFNDIEDFSEIISSDLGTEFL